MFDVKLPDMARIRMVTPAPLLEDISSAVRAQVGLLCPSSLKDQRIAITAGSRGINNISLILSVLVEELKKRGARPFLVPAMGSHGGATDEGQKEVLESLGITAESVGAPIESSMEVVQVGSTLGNIPVYLDKNAAGADGIIVVNRVKAHTEFSGEIESGLMKMLVIGLGKYQGASIAHTHALRKGYAHVFKEIGEVVLQNKPVLFGLAILENCYEQTAEIHSVAGPDFYQREKELLVKAKALMMYLPANKIDLLIIDEMGKACGGSGMDTDGVGRIMVYGQEEYTEPDIIRILVRDLNENSHGNATGIGIADFTTRRLAEKIDWPSTVLNCLTACTPEKARLPVVLDNDRVAVEAALSTIGLEDTSKARIIQIKNTLDLREMKISASLWEELAADDRISRLEPFGPMCFDDSDNLISM